MPHSDLRAAEIYHDACERGDIYACFTLWVSYPDGLWKKKDVVEWEAACNHGDAKACAVLGYRYCLAEGAPIDVERGRNLLMQACEAGYPKSCGEVAAIYATKPELYADGEQERVLWRRACDGGDVHACFVLAESHQSGLRGMPVDKAKAMELFAETCSKGQPDACNRLGWEHRKGGDAEANDRLAVEFFRKACDGVEYGGSTLGCVNLADMYRSGRGVERDEIRARELYRLGCDYGNAYGCQELWRLY